MAVTFTRLEQSINLFGLLFRFVATAKTGDEEIRVPVHKKFVTIPPEILVFPR